MSDDLDIVTEGQNDGSSPAKAKRSDAKRDDSRRAARPFKMTPQAEYAAVLLARAELTVEQVAETVGVARATLFRWRGHPDFQARGRQETEIVRNKIRQDGIAVMENRLRFLQERHNLMRRVIKARAESPIMKEVPGGDTGLLVHDVKVIGSGENAERLDVFEVDTGLLKELRSHEQQAAQELGQWAERHEVSGPNGGPIETKQTVPDWFAQEAAGEELPPLAASATDAPAAAESPADAPLAIDQSETPQESQGNAHPEAG